MNRRALRGNKNSPLWGFLWDTSFSEATSLSCRSTDMLPTLHPLHLRNNKHWYKLIHVSLLKALRTWSKSMFAWPSSKGAAVRAGDSTSAQQPYLQMSPWAVRTVWTVFYISELLQLWDVVQSTCFLCSCGVLHTILQTCLGHIVDQLVC